MSEVHELKKHPTLHDASMQAIDELNAILSANRPRVPEKLFVEFFLPVLTGEQKSVRMDYWLSLGDPGAEEYKIHPNSPVDIVDESGQVLFTVPPVFGAMDFFQRARATESFMDIVSVAMAQYKISPGLGTAYLMAEVERGFVTNAINADQKAWVDILKRYNRLGAILGVDLPDTSPKAESVKGASDDIFTDEYDEL
jgi:hypothetical protein